MKQFRRDFNEIWEEVDAVIDFFVSDLEKLEAINKNVIYLGKEDIYNIDVQEFYWDRETRQRQILNNYYQGNGIKIPVVVLAIEAAIESCYIFTELKMAFACDGYNTYTIEMETECVLYGLEYMPETVARL